MPDLDPEDVKRLRQRLQELGVATVIRRLMTGGFPTGMELAVENWLRENEAPAAKSRRKPLAKPRRKSKPSVKPRRKSANRKPTERPVFDWVVKAMTDLVKTDGPKVLDISVKNMRIRLQPANPNPKKPPSDEVISGARLEVLGRLKSVSDR
jgi:hypothetical protein